jgi:hypothetical protein
MKLSADTKQAPFVNLSMDKFGDIIVNSNLDAANVITLMVMAQHKLATQHLSTSIAAKIQEQQQVEQLTQLITKDPNLKSRG